MKQMPMRHYSGTYLRNADGVEYRYEWDVTEHDIRAQVGSKGAPLANVTAIEHFVYGRAIDCKEREQIAREWIFQHIEVGDIFDKRYLESKPKRP